MFFFLPCPSNNDAITFKMFNAYKEKMSDIQNAQYIQRKKCLYKIY